MRYGTYVQPRPLVTSRVWGHLKPLRVTMGILHSRISFTTLPRSIAIGAAFVVTATCQVRGAEADYGSPTVEVYSSSNSNSEPVVESPTVPRWRLPVHFNVSVSGGYDDNPNGEVSNPTGSLSTGASINAHYEFGTSRTRGTISSGTGVTYYPDLPTNRYDPNVFLNLSVVHEVNLRLTVTAAIGLNYRAEPDFSSELGLDRRAWAITSARKIQSVALINGCRVFQPSQATVSEPSFTTRRRSLRRRIGSIIRLTSHFGFCSCP